MHKLNLSLLSKLLGIAFVVGASACSTDEESLTPQNRIEVDNMAGAMAPDGYITPTSYSGMNLVWADEFDGNSLNTSNWSYELGDGCPDLCGWGNNELQVYKSENVSVANGHLVIEAREERTGAKAYTSGRIKTEGKQSFKYGRIDIRAKMPRGKGMWPALWMLGANHSTAGWPASGEIDIMEMIGGDESTVLGTCHWDHDGQFASYGGNYTVSGPSLADEFHVYSISWDDTFIRWYVDDIEYHVIDITPEQLSEFQQEFFFLFNVAVGGNLVGRPNRNTSFPQQMIVDYVRVFQ
ncbi:family 16 glycosylhydrolase [Roseivirga sp. BDSF3-8]|uniref:glycoside hydrolase family 16 protein n=1 Tax=Roseivirga sp. BDSF3-8 TaxID=3241598 RepID=UPI003531B8FB